MGDRSLSCPKMRAKPRADLQVTKHVSRCSATRAYLPRQTEMGIIRGLTIQMVTLPGQIYNSTVHKLHFRMKYGRVKEKAEFSSLHSQTRKTILPSSKNNATQRTSE